MSSVIQVFDVRSFQAVKTIAECNPTGRWIAFPNIQQISFVVIVSAVDLETRTSIRCHAGAAIKN
jgi:hypothetical protein